MDNTKIFDGTFNGEILFKHEIGKTPFKTRKIRVLSILGDASTTYETLCFDELSGDTGDIPMSDLMDMKFIQDKPIKLTKEQLAVLFYLEVFKVSKMSLNDCKKLKSMGLVLEDKDRYAVTAKGTNLLETLTKLTKAF